MHQSLRQRMGNDQGNEVTAGRTVTAEPYRVLARKYRPQSFDKLIGQDAMVRTLSNAIREDRIAHAFVLTGVRGVGKTTTARIIARALNCVGPDGEGGATVTPCGVCEHCRQIADSRHIDVLEMDAASRTGVDDIRELLDGVRYLPVSARFKVYIIDEVHMLSRNAFNALLKTLEEPPAQVKFIFATTEIRKIPVTVLSRCQRFDLKRVGIEILSDHFRGIVDAEGASIEDGALALISRAAEGSVRDGLSLLDQAIAHAGGQVTAAAVRDMLGLADREQVYDLFEAVIRGDMAAALADLRRQYDLGVDPEVVLQDMLELTHWLTRLKVVPKAEEDGSATEVERSRGRTLADKLTMPVLARAWQMLLKGLGEVRAAPTSLSATEMVLVRLAYSADLPPPADVIRSLESDGAAASDGQARTPAAPAPPRAPDIAPRESAPTESAPQASQPELAAKEVPAIRAEVRPIESFEGLVALATERREIMLSSLLRQNVQVVDFVSGRLAYRPAGKAPQDLRQTLKRELDALTGIRWEILVEEAGEAAPTLAERERAARDASFDQAAAHPVVQAVLETFPGAEIKAVRELGAATDSDEGQK